MNTGRINFLRPTRWQLAMSVNFRCTRPGCGLVTHFFDPSKNVTINIQGQAAHIHPASRRGPRSGALEVNLTVEQVRSFDNGVWLCANCATLIDRLPEDHPASMLRRWQEEAVERIRRTGLGASRHIPHDPRSDSLAVAAFLEKINGLVLRGWRPGNWISYEAVEALRDVHCSGIWRGPGNQKLAIQHSIRNRQICILELAFNQINAIRGMGSGYEITTDGHSNVVTGYSPTTEALASADKVRFHEIQRLADELRDYLNGPPLALSDADW